MLVLLLWLLLFWLILLVSYHHYNRHHCCLIMNIMNVNIIICGIYIIIIVFVWFSCLWSGIYENILIMINLDWLLLHRHFLPHNNLDTTKKSRRTCMEHDFVTSLLFFIIILSSLLFLFSASLVFYYLYLFISFCNKVVKGADINVKVYIYIFCNVCMCVCLPMSS